MSLPARQMTPKESREWNSWLSELMETVRPAPVANETDRERQKRISSLLGDFNKFCKYYFEDFMDSDFAWFHKKAAKEIVGRDNITFVGEWPREHAKSVKSSMIGLTLHIALIMAKFRTTDSSH